MSLVKLWAGRGTDEANFGSHRYRVWNDGSIWVDAEAVGPLVAVGGFALADPPARQAATGFARMAHRSDRTASCSFAGVTYVADADGVLTVPIAMAAELLAHGFAYVGPRRLPPIG
jgi:hypothetical protein